MKKALYIILLIAELVVGAFLLTLAWSVLSLPPVLVAIAIWIVLLVWQVIRLRKAADAKAKHSAKVGVALAMLFPSVAGITIIAWFIIELSKHM